LSLALNKDDSVRAVSWGKVVYDDQLRGFGRVIIVFHGKDYYSLYAFLSQSRVKVGQKIEKGEIIGQCGYYPRIKGTGLYFELRFRQKAINPLLWLEPA
jgi:septal ring factor EnvC (AmiA/AmiB activator)